MLLSSQILLIEREKNVIEIKANTQSEILKHIKMQNFILKNDKVIYSKFLINFYTITIKTNGQSTF